MGERFGIRFTLRARVPAADNCKGGALEQIESTVGVQDGWRIGNAEQLPRVGRVSPGQHVTPGSVEPFKRSFDRDGVGRCPQRIGHTGPDQGFNLLTTGRKNLLG